MSIDEEIAATENELRGMSHGAVMYPILTQKLVALRLAKQQAVPDHAAKPSAGVANAKKHWHDGFLGKIAVGVLVVLLGACALYVFRVRLGFPF